MTQKPHLSSKALVQAVHGCTLSHLVYERGGEVVDPEPILPMKKSGAGEERAHGHRAGKRWLGVESLHPISQELLMECFPLCVCHFSSRVPSSL